MSIKTIISFLSLLFVLTTCRQSNPKFESVELSLSDGWGKSLSFELLPNQTFTFSSIKGVRTGKLEDDDYDKLASGFLNLDDAKKNILVECIDCSVVSIIVKKDKRIIKILQKGNIEREIINLASQIDLVISKCPSKPVSYSRVFETAKDIMPISTVKFREN